MKRFFLFVAIALATMTAQAQPKWGTWSIVPHVGVSFSNISGDKIYAGGFFSDFDKVSKSKTRIGFSGGLDAVYQASDMLAVSFGAVYTQAGCNFEDVPANLSAEHGTVLHDTYYNLGYVDVPLVAHVYVSKGLAFSFGFQPSFLTNATGHYEMQDYETNKEGGIKYDKNKVNEENSKNLFKKTAFSIPIGISYEYENVVLNAHYNFGLSKVYAYDLGDNKNKIITVSVGYKFNL
ncbi:porin family protein [Prevotella disiens]|uniref:porin family protein n=1 Tax=Prevotella disiens TaxID=28130 RepID=UPI002888FE7D|nr:porin family protein [Prevotella disiens]